MGGGFFKTNGFSYHGKVLRHFDVQFVTEQDGNGDIVALFNGAILKCDGWAALKRKTCTIPRNSSPWSGIIKVKIVISHPGTRFQMSGTPGKIAPVIKLLTENVHHVHQHKNFYRTCQTVKHPKNST